MDFSGAGLKRAGFEGFLSVAQLMDAGARRAIPDGTGVYAVLYTGADPPKLLATSTAGWFKGKDPTLPIEELDARWVGGAPVVYIGMTGDGPRAGLRTRIRALVRFGTGHNIGHAGGRALWQLPSSGDLLVCWRPTTTGAEAVADERRLLTLFRSRYNQLPYANAI